MAQNSKDDQNVEFWYWNEDRQPDLAEAGDIINHESKSIKSLRTKVHDIRQSDEKITLDKHGFQVIQHKTAVDLPDGLDGVPFGPEHKRFVEAYWPETRDLIKSFTGARSVFIMESRFRRPPEDKAGLGKAPHSGDLRKSHTASHYYMTHNPLSVDANRNALRAIKPDAYELVNAANSTPQSEQQEFWRLRQEIVAAEDRAAEAASAKSYKDWDGNGYEGPRWAVIHLSQPLADVESSFYGVLDARSLIPIPGTCKERAQRYRSLPITYTWQITESFEGPNTPPLYPGPEDEHKWMWLKDQKRNELFATKYFDSEGWLEGSKVAPFTVWSTFDSPDGNGKPKISVDSLALLIW